MTAYTYRIGWSGHNKHYYGVRYAVNCSPDDLFNSYFTSSKHVKQFFKLNGKPDIIQIRKMFETKEQAINWEYRVLKRLKVTKNDTWMNKTDNRSFSPHTNEWTPEQRLKNSLSHKGKPSPNLGKSASIETKLKMRRARLGKKHTDEVKAKMGEIQKLAGGYGPKNMTDETKSKMSIARKNKRWVTNGVTCTTINTNDVIPVGFRLGKLHKKEMSNV